MIHYKESNNCTHRLLPHRTYILFYRHHIYSSTAVSFHTDFQNIVRQVWVICCCPHTSCRYQDRSLWNVSSRMLLLLKTHAQISSAFITFLVSLHSFTQASKKSPIYFLSTFCCVFHHTNIINPTLPMIVPNK